MTLTKNDLKALSNLIDERLEIKLEEKLESKLEEKLEQKLEEKLAPIRKAIKPIKSMQRTLNKLNKTVNIISGQYDLRLHHLENHSSHPPHRSPYVTA